MLHRVKLTNFGPHKSLEMHFTAGINLIVAPNGAGKSNIVYGVGWCIEGAKALPAEYNQSDIIRDGAEFCAVEIDVDIMGRLHLFHRQYDGKSVKVTVEVEGEMVATSAAGTTAYLNQIGLDPQAFSVLCSKQRDLDAFVHATPAQRKLLFDSLLRVGAIDEARKEARATSIAHRDTIKDEATLTENEAQSARNAFAASLTFAVGELDSVQRVVAELTTEIEKMRPDDAVAGTRKELMNQIRDLEDFYLRAQGIVDNMVELLTEGHRPYELVAKDLENIRDLMDANSELRENTIVDDASARDVVSEIRGQRAAIEDLVSELGTGTCPLCGGESGTEDESNAPDFEAHRTDDLAAAVGERHHYECQIEALSIVAGGIRIEQNNLVAELGDIEKRDGYEVTRVTAVDELVRVGGEIHEVAAQLATMPELPDLSNMYALMEKVQRYSKAELDLSGKVKWAELDLQKAEDLLLSVIESASEYAEALEKYADYKSTTEALGDFRDYVLQEALVWVSDRMTHIMHEFGTFPEIVEGSKLCVNSKLHFHFMSGEHEIPVYRFSGGQKAVFSIFLRVALSDYLTDRLGMNGLLILDAVFDSVDEENVAAAAQALEAVGPTQAIIFSHFDVPALDANRITI